MVQYSERHREGLSHGRKEDNRSSPSATAFLVTVSMRSLRTATALFGYTRSADSSKLQARNWNSGGNSLTSPYSLRLLTHLTVCKPVGLPSPEPQELPTDGCGLQVASCCK